MKWRAMIALFISIALCGQLSAENRRKLDTTIPYGEIMNMDPKDVDPSGLPLTAVESMHSTGTYQYVDVTPGDSSSAGPPVHAPLRSRIDELSRHAHGEKARNPDLSRVFLRLSRMGRGAPDGDAGEGRRHELHQGELHLR